MDIQEATSLLLLGNRAREKRGRRKRKKRVEVQGQQQQNQQQQQGSLDLVQMNRAVESLIMDDPPNQPQDFTRVLPPSIWEEWLWRSNPNDPPTSDALLNRNHLLGFLICRQVVVGSR